MFAIISTGRYATFTESGRIVTIYPRDGSTTISVDTRAAAEPDSLDAVMSTLEKIAADGKTCIVFDEFQDILKLDNANGILARCAARSSSRTRRPISSPGASATT